MYRLFREVLNCDDSSIRLIEITYFAATVTSFVYLRLGKQSNREDILDIFTQKILSRSIPWSREDISFDEAVNQYQIRFDEYNELIPLIFNPEQSNSGNAAATLLMHAYQCITQSSARGHMISITAASVLIQEYIFDHIDFVKKKL